MSEYNIPHGAILEDSDVAEHYITRQDRPNELGEVSCYYFAEFGMLREVEVDAFVLVTMKRVGQV